MKNEILSIAKQFILDCKEQENIYKTEVIIWNKDGDISARSSIPYIADNISLMVVFCHYQKDAVAYYSGNPYRYCVRRHLCLTDDGDSETCEIDGWKFEFTGLYFEWNVGDQEHIVISKGDRKYILRLHSNTSLCERWPIVKLFLQSRNQDHLDGLLQNLIDSKEMRKISSTEYKLFY